MFDSDRPARGYALLWPRDLFRAELGNVLAVMSRGRQQRGGLELLFTEALRGPDPLEDLPQASASYFDDEGPWAASPTTTRAVDSVEQFGFQILEHVGALPPFVPRRYYLERRTLEPPKPRPRGTDWPALGREWTAVVEDLVARGYLDRLAGDRWADHKENRQDQRISELIENHCGLAREWPLGVRKWVPEDAEYLLTLIEVFHDLMARPRLRDWHEYDEHYWYSAFDEATGQAVYRWMVNELLDRHGVDLQLAESGEDLGFLVHSPSDPRRDLLEQVREHVPDGNAGRVDHAIALFRNRAATVEDKRSACKALADVLENRRPIIEASFNGKDEGDLFMIANRFGIRHHDAKQRLDYPEDYLNWIFWWYLATAELTNRLMIRDQTGD